MGFRKKSKFSLAIFLIVLMVLVPINSAIGLAEDAEYGGNPPADSGDGEEEISEPEESADGEPESEEEETVTPGTTSIGVELPDYANSDEFRITGTAPPKYFVDVFTNGNLYHTTTANSDGEFTVSRIILDKEENEVRVLIRKNSEDPGKEYVKVIKVDDIYPEFSSFKKPPKLITEPNFKLSGSLSEPCDVVATLSGADESVVNIGSMVESFNYTFSFPEGETFVEIKAIDKAGNEVIKSFSVVSDSEAPVIEEHNLPDVSPTYSRTVTVRGKVSEPSTVRIIVNGKGNSKYQCSDGEDNDKDGLVDYPNDPGCGSPVGNLEAQPEYNFACSNGKDDDEDGNIDFPDDLGCDNARDTDEENYNGTTACNNGKDDDDDGRIDFNPAANGDWGCSGLSDNSEDDDFDIGKVYTVQTNDDGEFSKEITLDFKLSTTTSEMASSNTVKSDTGEAVSLNFGTTSEENEIEIIAIDKAGNIGKANGNVKYATCSSGEGDLLMLQDQIYPTSLIPDHIFQGIAQISFSLKLDYIGMYDKSQVYVTGINLRTRELSTEDADDWDMNIFDPGKCVSVPDKAGGFNWYVTCTLKRWPADPYRNITAAYEDFEEQQRVHFPIDLEVHYTETYDDAQGKQMQNSKTQKVCYDMDYMLDIRADPDNIPRELLNSSVELLNTVIETIDDILPLVTQAKWIVAIGCFGMFVVNYLSNLGETVSCIEVKAEQPIIETAVRGSPGYDITQSSTATKFLNDKLGDKKDKAQSCVDVKSRFYQTTKTRRWLCDRIFCPTVPSAQQYKKEQMAAKESTSPCAQKNEKVEISGLKFDTNNPETMCEVDYENEWRSACAARYPYAESKALYDAAKGNKGDPDLFSTVGGFLKGLSVCTFFGEDTEKKDLVYTEDGYSVREDRSGDGPNTYTLGRQLTVAELKDGDEIDAKTRKDNFVESEVSFADTKIANSFGTNPNVVKDGNCVVAQPKDLPAMSSFKEDKISYETLGDPKDGEIIRVGKLEGKEIPAYYTDNEAGGCKGATDYYRDNNGLIYCKITKKGVSTFTKATPMYISRTITSGEGGSLSTFKASSKKENCLRSQSVQNTEIADTLIVPSGSVINSLMCVCIPAIEGYLITIKNIAIAIRNCFESILVTGEFDAGICRAILTQYLCDFVYELIGCLGKSFSLSSEEIDNAERPDQVNMLKSMFTDMGNAGSKIKKATSERYGKSQSFRKLFNERQLIHSICLAAFGYDWQPDLDAALSMSGGGISINTTAVIAPATRRFMSSNPTKNGVATYTYHVGYFMTAGEPLSWRLELICSNTNDCDDGPCDCAHGSGSAVTTTTNPNVPYTPYAMPATGTPGVGIAKLIDGGHLEGGETVGSGGGNPYSTPIGTKGTGDLYINLNDPVRYDKVRMCWTADASRRSGDQNVGKSGCTDMVPLKTIGGRPPASCTFSVALGAFSCSYFAPEDGAIYLNSIKELRNGQEREPGESPVLAKEELQYNIKYTYVAPQEGRDVSKKFIVATVRDENNINLNRVTVTPYGDLEIKNGNVVGPVGGIKPATLVGDGDNIVQSNSETGFSVGGWNTLDVSELSKKIKMGKRNRPTRLVIVLNKEREGLKQYVFYQDVLDVVDGKEKKSIEEVIEKKSAGILVEDLTILDTACEGKKCDLQTYKGKIKNVALKGLIDPVTLTLSLASCTPGKTCAVGFDLVRVESNSIKARCDKTPGNTLDWTVNFAIVEGDGTGRPSTMTVPTSDAAGKKTQMSVPLKIACHDFDSEGSSSREVLACGYDTRLSTKCYCGDKSNVYEVSADPAYCLFEGKKLVGQLSECSIDPKKGFNTDPEGNGVCQAYKTDENGKKVYTGRECSYGQYYEVGSAQCKCAENYKLNEDTGRCVKA